MSTPNSGIRGDERPVAGRYRRGRLLGSGGMGIVWCADDVLLLRPVALKELVFPPWLSEDQRDAICERSLREARAAARINSPHAVRVYDVVEDEGRPFIVMELVLGRTLSDVVHHDGPLAPAEAARIGLAVLDALVAAHAVGVIHRDVKPSNVMIRDDGHVTLTDFGIARTDGDPRITSTGLLLGSPSYVAPELVRGAAPVPASDLWSLGATLYTLVEGRPPFERREPFITLAAVVADEPPPLRTNGLLGHVVRRLLAKEPATRPAAAEVRRVLSALAASRDPKLASPLPAPEVVRTDDRTLILPHAIPAASETPAIRIPAPSAASSARPPRWRDAALLAAALAVVVGMLAGALLLLRPDRTPADRRTSAQSPSGGPAAAAAPLPPASTARAGGAAGRPVTTPAPSGGARASTTAASSAATWARYTDPSEGWSVAYPAGWQVRRQDGLTDIVDPTRRRYLRVDTQTPAGPSALGAWQQLERVFAGRHTGYSRVRMESVDWRGYRDVADWEFTYTAGGTRLHALDRGFVVGNTGYALYFQTRDSEWAASASLREALFASMRVPS